jgi:hypothetical protein
MKKYEIEIHGNWLEDRVNADIKYPCGEIVQTWSCDTFVEAGKKVNEWIEQNPFVNHESCKSEYCRG